MLKHAKKTDMKKIIIVEKNLVQSHNSSQNFIKDQLNKYMKEFKNISFDNDILKTMLLNNFSNAIVQIDNNLLNIESLNNILDILEKQEKITVTDVETYNKLATKIDRDIELLENFLSQTFSNFENVSMKGSQDSIALLNICKENILKETLYSKVEKDSQSDKTNHPKITPAKAIKKIDVASSDLLCFFPKNSSDSLVISTSQENYRISFNYDVASISIEDEKFNLSLKTPGVQFSNSVTNDIVFVSYANGTYTILTNSKIETPTLIKVSKISKNDDFLEVEIISDTLNLLVEENVIKFEEFVSNATQNVYIPPTIPEPIKPQPTPQVIPQPVAQPVQQPVRPPVVNTAPIVEPETVPEVQEVQKKEPEQTSRKKVSKQLEEEENIPESIAKIEPPENDADLVDNNTLIISDSNKNVILPYTVAELEKKLRDNKKYKSLHEIVEKEYTIPLETFKNPTKSRFREAFQLIKKREHGSLKEAIELGFELMFQSDLNPAVIAACKDLDELDIYLDCLDDNELDKFSCFNIQYDVPPTSKSKK